MTRKTHGLRAWLWQRISSVYIALYVLGLGGSLLLHPPADYLAWRDWMGNTAVGIATALFFGALLIHAWVGTRDVIMDYIHPLAARWLFLGVVGIMLAGSGVWALDVLYGLH